MLDETGAAADPKQPVKDIVDRMDENTFVVEDKYGKFIDVDKFYIRSLDLDNKEVIDKFESIFFTNPARQNQSNNNNNVNIDDLVVVLN